MTGPGDEPARQIRNTFELCAVFRQRPTDAQQLIVTENPTPRAVDLARALLAPVEERERRMVLVVDLSGSQRFGTSDTLKVELAAEVASVAVERASHGSGLGGLVVRAVEAMARQRGHREVFAVTRAEPFFESLGYGAAELARYPEKRARYDALREQGIHVDPKPCMRKVLA